MRRSRGRGTSCGTLRWLAMTRRELIPSDVLDRVEGALASAPNYRLYAEFKDARFLESVEARRVRDVLIGFPHASEDRLCSMLAPVDRAVVRRVLVLLKEPA